MKKLLILFIGLTLAAFTTNSFNTDEDEINWMTLEEAIEAQKEEPRKIMIDAFTTWCGPCKLLDKNTFHHKDVVEYINENYYAVKFNAEGNDEIRYKGFTYKNPEYVADKKGRNSMHQLAKYFGVRAYPTLLFLDEKANVIGPIPGYKTPRQLEIYLKLFKDDEHKKMTTKEVWNDYVTNFEYEFDE